MPETFTAKIIADGRITVPETVREILKLCEGMAVRVTIEKIRERS